MKPLDLLPFQEATARWASRQMKLSSRLAARYLIADEVGLGKTRIAAAVVDSFRVGTEPLHILYLAPRADMCRQNGQAMASALGAQWQELSSLLLLYSKAQTEQVLRLSSLPVSALDVAPVSIRTDERIMLAHILSSLEILPLSLAIHLLKGRRSKKSFQQRLQLLGRHTAALPESLARDIRRRLQQSNCLLVVGAKRLSYREHEQWVKQLRSIVFETFLRHLPCDVLVMDEVHQWAEFWLEDGTQEGRSLLARYLWEPRRPTLLLSATPLHFRSAQSPKERMEKLLEFISGHTNLAKQQMKSLDDFQTALVKAEPASFADLQNQKHHLEQQLLRFMSRTERGLLLGQEARPESSSPLLPVAELWSDSSLKAWFHLRQRVRDPQALQQLIMSQAPLLSYAPMTAQYKAILRQQKFAGLDRLFSQLQEYKKNPRLRYLQQNLLGAQSQIEDYLWIPPGRPYYVGEGAYAPRKLREFYPQKALVCSEQPFVPRFLSAELSAALPRAQSSVKKRSFTPHFLHWAKVLFPSQFLASLWSLEESSARLCSAHQLQKLIERRLLAHLKQQGWVLGKTSQSAAQLLLAIETQLDDRWPMALAKRYSKEAHPWDRAAPEKKSAISATQSRHLLRASRERIYSIQQIEELAQIAVASPAVCLWRCVLQLAIVPREDPYGSAWLTLADFCARLWQRFASREHTQAVILKQQKRGESYADAMLRYMREGNIQAMLLEYLFHLKQTKAEMNLAELMRRLSLAIDAPQARFRVATAPQASQVVRCQQVLAFGKYEELGSSRDAQREAFNSPFWPFVLITHGQADEGLDFHLYCRDIYHWDGTQVQDTVQQREGRINRFHSYGVRRQVLELCKDQSFSGSGSTWVQLYAKAAQVLADDSATRLGLSPHWGIPRRQGLEALYRRHFLLATGHIDRRDRRKAAWLHGLRDLGWGLHFEDEAWQALLKNLFLRHIDPISLRFDLRPYERASLEKSSHLPWAPLLQGVRERLLEERETRGRARVLEQHVKTLQGEPKLFRKLVHSFQALLSFMSEPSQDESQEDGWQDPWSSHRAS